MMLSGHKTNAVYRRYDIIDEQDIRDSMAGSGASIAANRHGCGADPRKR